MPTWVASIPIGDGQSAQTTDATVSLSGSGAVAGNLLLVFLDNSLSTNTYSAGPTVIRSDANGSNSKTWVAGKLLTAADITAGSVTITFGTAARIVGLARLWSSAAVPSAAQTAAVSETTAVNTPDLPSLAVAAGSAVEAAFLRRRVGTAGTVGIPAAYTSPTGGHAGSAYSSGINVFTDGGYIASSAGGTVGGESGSGGNTAVGNNYLVEVPAGTVDAIIPVPSAFVGGGQAPAAPGTVVPVPSAFVGAPGSTVSPTASVTAPVPSASVGSAGSSVTASVSASPAVPSALISAGGASAAQATVLYRFQWWNGSAWDVISPRVWDGSHWLVIPVTLTPSIT